MSEFQVHVVRLGKVGKHPNADTLSITTVYGYPVIFKSGAFAPGDLAVRIPIDAVVRTDIAPFAWLQDKATNNLFRVKAAKLRGVPSYGFLVPIHEVPNPEGRPLTEGTDVRDLLQVTKYDPGPCYNQDGVISGEHFTTAASASVPLYDIEGLRRYGDLLQPGENVWVSEKVHGSNGRWAHIGGQFLCGSRTKFRSNSVWNRVGDAYGLESILGQDENQGLVLYGEVYGPGIQDLTYGADKPKAVFFDIYDTKNGVWYDVARFLTWCSERGLPTAPTLYIGPYDPDAVMAMAEGKTTLPGADHVREGIVVKPLTERWNQDIGRVFLKLPGEGYLLRKGA